MFDKDNVEKRKWLYYAFNAGIVAWVIAMVIIFIIWCIYSDNVQSQALYQCMIDPNLQAWFGYSADDCADSLRTFIIITVIVCTAFGLWINLLFARMLYHGW